MPDLVKIAINGTEFAGWEALTITRTIDSVADAFSLSGPFEPDSIAMRSAFRPFGYQPCKVSIDDEMILTGQIEAVSPATTATDRTINVQGRSLTGPLVECGIDGVGYQFAGLSLLTIAQRLCKPFGIEAMCVGVNCPPLKEATADPGESPFSFLNRLAQDAGLLLTCDAMGRLIITKINPTGTPVSSLIEGTGLLMAVNGSYDGTQRHSLYKVLQQQDGTPGITGKATDSGVKVYRPKVETGSESDAADVNKSAAWKRALALAGSVGISATMSGWRTPSGKLWTPGDIVTMQAPGAFIFTETPLVIAEATLTLDTSQGRTAGLRLVLPATYTGEMPRSYPWA